MKEHSYKTLENTKLWINDLVNNQDLEEKQHAHIL